MEKIIKTITIPRPNDMHAHLREKKLMQLILLRSNFYGRVVAMGNLSHPIITNLDVIRYSWKIEDCSPLFEPIMTIMLVNSTSPQIIRAASDSAKVLKLIPGGTSTNSESGVRLEDLEKYYPILKEAEEEKMIFSGHWELINDPKTGKEIHELERETAAIPYLKKVVKAFPRLRIIVEHASTREMIEFVKNAPANVAATLTAHHALLTYNKVCDKKEKIINPHIYCKPIAKLARDRRAVIEAMLSDNPKFFFGSDSAPHPPEKKKLPNPQAGIFTPGEIAIPLLAEIFDNYGELEKFKRGGFTSGFGAKFYGLPPNENSTLKREKWTVPKKYEGIVSFWAGHELNYKILT